MKGIFLGQEVEAEEGTAIVNDSPLYAETHWVRTENLVGERIPVLRITGPGVVRYLDNRGGKATKFVILRQTTDEKRRYLHILRGSWTAAGDGPLNDFAGRFVTASRNYPKTFEMLTAIGINPTYIRIEGLDVTGYDEMVVKDGKRTLETTRHEWPDLHTAVTIVDCFMGEGGYNLTEAVKP